MDSKMYRKNNCNKSNREGEASGMRRNFDFSEKGECAEKVPKRPLRNTSEQN